MSGPASTSSTAPTTTTATTPALGPSVDGAGVDDYGLYAMDLDGTNLRRIAGFGAFGPAWSPDGKWIAYSGATLVSPTTGETRLRNAPAGPANGSEKPSWSPDSTRIAFIGAPPTDLQNLQPIVRDVWIAAVDGGPSARIATTEQEMGVEWLPDGRIAALSRDGIWTFAPDGSDRRRVYSGKLPTLPTSDEAAWGTLEASPDGRFLAVILFESAETLVLAVDGTNPRFVASPDTNMRNRGTVSWSPSGGEFIVARAIDGQPAAYVLQSDGPAERLLDSSLARPAWSPSGESVVGFDNLAGGRYRSLVGERPDGTGRRTILTVGERFRLDPQHQPAFSRDGRTVLFTVFVP